MPPSFVHTGRLLGQGVPVVNRALPLAQNLLACYVPAIAPSGRISNLASPGLGDLTTRSGTAVANSPTQEGPGIFFNSTTASAANGPTPASWQKASGQSIFVRGKSLGVPTTNKPAYLLGVACASSPFNCWVLGVGGSGAGGGNALALFYQTTSAAYTGTTARTTNAMFSGGATFGAGAPAILYYNGIQDTLTGSPPNVAITYAGAVTTYLGLGTSSAIVDTTMTVGYLWNRVLTAGEMQYLDANPYALLLWPSDRALLALVTLTGSGTAVRADAILAAEFLESLLSDSDIPEESLAIGSPVTGNATLPVEFSATVLRDWGAGAARSMIRRSSRLVLVGRVRRLFFPGRPGTLAIESEGRQHADPGAPIESLGSAGNSVAGDAMSPIETASSQRRELGAAIENTARLQVDPGAPAEALAASLLDINSPVEALAGGITTTTDTNLAIEWVTSAPSILLSLESGPERVRLLATRGRVRLLRRK
jgi:hypothetical protein